MKLWNFLAAIFVAALLTAGCGEGERVTILKKDRDEVLATATAQAQRVGVEMKRVEEEANTLNLKAQDMRNAIERQQEALQDLSFAVRTLSETLNQKKSEIEKKDIEAANKRSPFMVALIALLVIGIIAGILWAFLRSKPAEEEDDDLYGEDDEFELGEEGEDFGKDNAGDGAGDDKPKA